MGRRTRLTPEVMRVITNVIAKGGSDKAAYEAVGIGETTFYAWLKKGEVARRSDSVYREFWEGLTRARSLHQMYHLGTINAAADKGDWRASAWILERRYPDVYGKQHLEIKGQHQVESEITIRIAYEQPESWNSPSGSDRPTKSKG